MQSLPSKTLQLPLLSLYLSFIKAEVDAVLKHQNFPSYKNMILHSGKKGEDWITAPKTIHSDLRQVISHRSASRTMRHCSLTTGVLVRGNPMSDILQGYENHPLVIFAGLWILL